MGPSTQLENFTRFWGSDSAVRGKEWLPCGAARRRRVLGARSALGQTQIVCQPVGPCSEPQTQPLPGECLLSSHARTGARQVWEAGEPAGGPGSFRGPLDGCAPPAVGGFSACCVGGFLPHICGTYAGRNSSFNLKMGFCLRRHISRESSANSRTVKHVFLPGAGGRSFPLGCVAGRSGSGDEALCKREVTLLRPGLQCPLTRASTRGRRGRDGVTVSAAAPSSGGRAVGGARCSVAQGFSRPRSKPRGSRDSWALRACPLTAASAAISEDMENGHVACSGAAASSPRRGCVVSF